MNRTTLVLVRHGETAWNVEGRIQGHLDVPLNETGLAQADATGRRLAGEKFDAIYSSDLIRAYRTASPVVANPDAEIVREPRLRERHLGVLQGLTGEEALARQPAAWKVFKARDPALPLEAGESLGGFARRIVDFVEEKLAAHSGGRVLMVTHGGALDAVLSSRDGHGRRRGARLSDLQRLGQHAGPSRWQVAHRPLGRHQPPAAGTGDG